MQFSFLCFCTKMIHSTSALKRASLVEQGGFFRLPTTHPLALSTPEGASFAWNDAFHHCPHGTMMEMHVHPLVTPSKMTRPAPPRGGR